MGLLGKLTGSDAAEDAASKARRMVKPFVNFGKRGITGIEDLLAGNIDLFSLPGVQRSFDSGAEAMQRRLSAQGYRGSGNEMLALADYTGDFSRGLYNDYFGQMFNLASLGANAAAGAGTNTVSAGNTAAQQGNMFTNVGNLAQGGGELMKGMGALGI